MEQADIKDPDGLRTKNLKMKSIPSADYADYTEVSLKGAKPALICGIWGWI